MSDTRRKLLMAGAAIGVLGPVLSACEPTTVVDNATGNTTGGASGLGASGGGGDSGCGNTATGGGAGGSTSTGGNTTSGGTGAGSSGGGTLPAGPRVRYDVSSPQGQQMLAVYAKAVGLMMALPDSDPRSWVFQWYSHFSRDDRGKASEIARVYGSAPSPQRSLALQMWDGCQAHGANEDENFFLPWHRMYVFAFENIVRAIADEPNFTLPYWNYSNPSQRAIPAQFRRPGDPVWGPLYRPNRGPGVNAGQPIAAAGDLAPGVLTEGTYSPLGGDQGFNANLDAGLHGTVHVGVGDATTGMGAIPWAANDPIFWLHHCNIDRLWASWNAEGNANPSDGAFTAKGFVFAGPTGAQITYTVGNVLSLSQMGYGYDALIASDGSPAVSTRSLALTRAAPGETPPASSAPQPMMLMSKRSAPLALKTAPSISHLAEGVRLGGAVARVRLTGAQAAPEAAVRALAPLIAPPVRMQKKTVAVPPPSNPLLALFKPKPIVTAAPPPAPAAPPPAIPAPKPGQKVFLVITDLSTDVQPGVLYQIYLEAPRTGGGAPEPFPIGTLNFFAAMTSMPGMGAMGANHHARSYDITALADSLAAQGRLEASPQISFAPIGRPASQSQPLIGRISLAIQ